VSHIFLGSIHAVVIFWETYSSGSHEEKDGEEEDGELMSHGSCERSKLVTRIPQ